MKLKVLIFNIGLGNGLGGVPNGCVISRSIYAKNMAATARCINSVALDVVFLQEVDW